MELHTDFPLYARACICVTTFTAIGGAYAAEESRKLRDIPAAIEIISRAAASRKYIGCERM